MEVVAVSTDPQRDTVQRVAEYTEKLGLDRYPQWRYLVGTREELAPIWNAYLIGNPIITEQAAWASQKDLEFYGLLRGLGDQGIQDANAIRGQYGGGYDVGHITPVWLINEEGSLRVKLGQDLTPDELVEDVRRLLQE